MLHVGEPDSQYHGRGKGKATQTGTTTTTGVGWSYTGTEKTRTWKRAPAGTNLWIWTATGMLRL